MKLNWGLARNGAVILHSVWKRLENEKHKRILIFKNFCFHFCWKLQHLHQRRCDGVRSMYIQSSLSYRTIQFTRQISSYGPQQIQHSLNLLSSIWFYGIFRIISNWDLCCCCFCFRLRKIVYKRIEYIIFSHLNEKVNEILIINFSSFISNFKNEMNMRLHF